MKRDFIYKRKMFASIRRLFARNRKSKKYRMLLLNEMKKREDAKNKYIINHIAGVGNLVDFKGHESPPPTNPR